MRIKAWQKPMWRDALMCQEEKKKAPHRRKSLCSSRMLPSAISFHAVWTLYTSGRHSCLSLKRPMSHKNPKWQRNLRYDGAKHRYRENMLQPTFIYIHTQQRVGGGWVLKVYLSAVLEQSSLLQRATQAQTTIITDQLNWLNSSDVQ